MARRRTSVTVLVMACALGLGLAWLPPARAGGARKKAAEHATVEGDPGWRRIEGAGRQGSHHLARHDPRGHGAPAQRLVAQAGRAGRRSWAIFPVADRRASRASRSWRSSTPATASTRS